MITFVGPMICFENKLDFLSEPSDALHLGFKPCKLCNWSNESTSKVDSIGDVT